MTLITKTCERCEAAFSGVRWATKDKRYCSKVCRYESAVIDLTGSQFGRLTVVSRGIGGRWNCTCECGGTCAPSSMNLRSGKTKSCGCLSREVAGNAKRTHGMHLTPTYYSWSLMLKRCRTPTDPAYKAYGGRGIDFDPRWLSFKTFLSDMGERPDGTSIDRIDNARGYWPDNCRWANKLQQQRNIRSNRNIEYKGRVQCVRAWSAETGLPNFVFYNLVRKGLTDAEAVAAMIETPDDVKPKRTWKRTLAKQAAVHSSSASP